MYQEEKNIEQKKISSLNKELDFDIAKTILKKNWFWVPIIIITGLVSAFIYLRYTKPLFESSAIIQRTSKDEGKRILEIENFDYENTISEDVELLRSTFLLEKALKNLNLKISYFSEGQILTEEKYLHSPYHIIFLELKDSSLIGSPIYVQKENEKIYLKYNSNQLKKEVEIIPGEIYEGEDFALNLKINDLNRFDKDISENKLYFIFNDYGDLTKRLHPYLNVYVLNQDAKTIHVSFKSNNSLLATDVVSSLIETFFEYDLEKKSQSSANVLKFIDEQLDTVYNQLKISESDIQLFKDSNKTKDPEYFKDNVLSQIDILQTQSIDADLEFQMLKDISLSVNSKDRVEVYNLLPIISGTRFQSSLENQINKLHDLLEQKEDASYNMTVENDNLKKINTNIENQIQTINRSLESIRNQVKTKRDGIQKKIHELESQLYGLPEKEMELSRLKRKFVLNEKYYSLLIEKRTQYEISKAGYTIDNRTLQNPTSSILISPQKQWIYLGVFLISLLISIIFLFVKYITFNHIHNEIELKKISPSFIGNLGFIPKNKKDFKVSTLVVHNNPKSYITESFRNIRTNLQFILKKDKGNLLAISSTISGEGKTFVAINIAGVYAMSDKKVLVLDLDLRKPKVHIAFRKNNENGMSSVLSGKETWRNCLQETELENLKFISAGILPPNPYELINNAIIDEILDEMKQEFDLIIIDNPPVGIVSDGVSIMNKADCAIYLFRANYSKRIFVNKLVDLISHNKIKNLYTLLNDVDSNKSSYGYGYGGYYEDIK